ncbi:hypothetical protein CPB84DRAFT_1789100 [Gymnopilus junonius]|uniref:Fe2OG dioxygenase domain-containing protein n=1 Tax=Gymnopilus junonius TaxID=109634 RepID=A0A9P5NGX7_GYMJU|nr:hypothetical protein CPB84DRAFT_1789100 [Gymnopilus junonius]
MYSTIRLTWLPYHQTLLWLASKETDCIPDSEYVDLTVIDISSLIANPDLMSATAQHTIDEAIRAFQETGFIVITGHGLTPETISRQFDLAYMWLSVSEKVKHEFHTKISEGSWAGYKPQGYYKRSNCARDTTESHDFYPKTVIKDLQPAVFWPYLDEIREFYNYTHFVLLHTLLLIISQGLGMDRDSFWNMHRRKDGPQDIIHTRDLFRGAMYHPPSEEDRSKMKKLWLPVHTDRGSLTFLYLQPTAGLQVFVNDRWKYIQHYPSRILVNVGDAMEFTTGGLLKAAVHRVHEPPDDQRYLPRLGLFYFATMLPEIPLQPFKALASLMSPLPDGIFEEFEGKIPTAGGMSFR